MLLRNSSWGRQIELRRLSTRSLSLLALERPNDPLVFRQLGDNLSQEGDLPGSLQAFHRAVELDPKDYESQVSLGAAFVAAGRPYDAERCWVAAAQLRPKEADPHFLLASLYDTYRNKSSTIAPLQKVTQLNPRHAEAWYRLGVALEDLHQYDQALPALEKAANLAPERRGYLRDLAQIQMHFGRLKDARQSLNRAAALPEADPGVLVLLAQIDLEEGLSGEKLGGAEKLLHRALELDGKYPPAHRSLGTLYTRRGEHEKAVKSLKQAIRYDPSDGQALFELGRALIRTGRKQEGEYYVKGFQLLSEARRSVKVLEDRIHQDPKNPALRLRVARLYRRYGDHTRAINQYQVYLSQKPDPVVGKELERYRRELEQANAPRKS